jgi:rhamnose transport system ATP-binding protein
MGDTSQGELIRLMVGRAVEATYPRRAVPLGDLRLELVEVGCREVGIRDVSLTLSSNEIVGLAGLVGSGRTELARTLFGLTPPDEGVVRLDGKVVHIKTPSEAVRLGLAYLPEDRRRHGVIGEMSVAANTTLAALRAISRAGFLEFEKEREVARTYLRRFAIKAPSIETPVATLSGGNQQKVALARWLATQPSVLILDEPTQGVDVGAKAEIHWLIRDLAAQGLAILLISSELPEVLGMSDRVAVMRAGTIVGTLEGKAATPESVMTLALGHVPGGDPSPS